MAEICSLDAGDIETGTHRPVIASCGNNFVFAEVKSRAILAKAAVRTDVLARHIPMARAVGLHLYCHAKEHGVEIQSRMFAPLYGVPEDPATGSANVVLIGLLAHFGPRRTSPSRGRSARASTWAGRASSKELPRRRPAA